MYAMPDGVAVESKKDVEQPSAERKSIPYVADTAADLRWLSVQELALAVQQLSTELATLKQESAASIQSLSEEVTQLKLNANNEPIVTLEGEDEDAVILSKPTSLYAWCFERLCQPLSIGKLLHAFSLLLLLTVAQLTLAFAFLDATWWVANAGKEFPAYKEAVEVHNFYTGKHLEYGGERQPIVNVLASFVAGVLLVIGPLHEDVMQTLIAPQPVDRLLFRKGTSRVGKTRWMQDALLVIPLQLAWALRCFLLPVCAAMGTSFALGSADSAVDIVLNSVAVGFLFELDDVMYTSKQQQHTIAASSTHHSPLSTHHSPLHLSSSTSRR